MTRSLLISYSLTGNNEALAASIANALGAERIRVTEPGVRTMGTIVLDVLFSRTPVIEQKLDGIEAHDLVIFVGPVWMGRVASPLRPGLRRLRGWPGRYAFVTVSGGADGPNPNLGKDLTKLAGKPPSAVIDLHIAELLPPHPEPTRKDTMRYRLNPREAERLGDTAVKALREAAGPGGTGTVAPAVQGYPGPAGGIAERRAL